MTKRVSCIHDILPRVDECELSFDGFRCYVDGNSEVARRQYDESYSHVSRVRAVTAVSCEKSLNELNTGIRINMRRIARIIASDGAYLVEDNEEALISAWVVDHEVAVRVHRDLLAVISG